MILIALSTVIPGVLLSILGFQAASKQKLLLIQTIGDFPALEEQFNRLKKLEETLAKEAVFLVVLNSSIVPQFQSSLSEPAARSTETRGNVFKRLFEKVIRKKIGDDPKNLKHIITVHKVGYKFIG